MTLPVYVVGEATLTEVAASASVLLEGPEGRHAVTVRRTRVGETIELVDGAGTRCRGTVTSIVDPTSLVVEVEQVTREPRPEPTLVVVQALAKGDRGETAVETLTEVGVDEVVPWQAERCVVRWAGEKSSAGVARWRRTAHEAAKQSRRARFPVLSDVVSTPALLERVRAASLALVLDEQAHIPITEVVVPRSGDVVVVVGPEGGISPDEAAALEAAGAVAVRLGPTVLRTSTAGTVAAAVLLAASGRWMVSDGSVQ